MEKYIKKLKIKYHDHSNIKIKRGVCVFKKIEKNKKNY